jgi:hypothetical protein
MKGAGTRATLCIDAQTEFEPADAAAGLSAALRERRVWTDYRGDVVRLGLAPYVADGQLTSGIAALGEALRVTG